MATGHSQFIQNLLLLCALLGLYAQAAIMPTAQKSPPWAVHSTFFVMVTFKFEVEDNKKFISGRATPQVNERKVNAQGGAMLSVLGKANLTDPVTHRQVLLTRNRLL